MANDYILEVSWGCPSDKWPINGLFQFDQAKAISDSGKRVVFLALDLRSIRRWRKWGLNKFNKNGIDVYEYNFPLGGFKPSIKYAVQDYAFRRGIKTIVKELGIRPVFTSIAVSKPFPCRTIALPTTFHT